MIRKGYQFRLVLRNAGATIKMKNDEIEQSAAHINSEQQHLMHNLQERVKELNCLYGISKIVEKHGNSLDEIMNGIVDLIPPAWQYPSVTCARIFVDGKEYTTDNFEQTKWKQAADILVSGSTLGIIEVFYLDEKPEEDEGPFIKEERYLIEAISERIGCIIEHKRSEDAVLERESLLSSLSQKVITVLEEERERVARELHDSIGQQLAAMRLEILWIKDRLSTNADKDMFRNLINMTLNASEELKHICMNLRPVVLDKMGFVAAIEELIKEFGLNTDLNIASDITHIDESILKPAMTINIYRILQETMTNVVRHSEARNVGISFRGDGGYLVLEVKDDGKGISSVESIVTRGFGIMGMKERTKIVGGEFFIKSVPGGGTLIRVSFPVRKQVNGIER